MCSSSAVAVKAVHDVEGVCMRERERERERERARTRAHTRASALVCVCEGLEVHVRLYMFV